MNFTLRLFLTACLLAGAPAWGQTPAAAPGTNAAPAAPAPPPVLAPADIITQGEKTLAELRTTASSLTSDALDETVTQKLAPFATIVEASASDTTRVLAANPSLDEIRALDKSWAYLRGYPAGWKEQVNARTTELGKTLAKLDGEKKLWADTQTQLDAAKDTPPEIAQRVRTVLAGFQSTRDQVAERQADLLKLENQVAIIDNQVTDMIDDVAAARNRAVNELFVMNRPPIWRAQDEAMPGQTLHAKADNSLHGQWITLRAYLGWASVRFLIHAAVLAVLVIFFFWVRGKARHWAEQDPALTPSARIFETPVAAAVLLSLALSGWLYPLAPRLWLAGIGAIALIPTVIIVRRLIEPRLFPILDALVIFFFVEEFRSVSALPHHGGRLLFLVEIVAGILFLLWLLVSKRLVGASTSTNRFGRAIRLAARGALIVLLIGWIANVLGYVLLANLLGEGIQRSADLALVLYAGIRILEALLQIALRVRPVSDLGMVRLHREMLLTRANRVLVFAASVGWALYTLEMFQLRAPVLGGIFALLNTRLTHRDLPVPAPGHPLASAVSPLTIGGGLEAVLFVVAAFYLSRFVRFVMECEIYPRLRLASGIPYAVSTMLHYAILAVALYFAADQLSGADMMQFTIVVSALSVGIGFGLQNIINNFVSGLILLFERPVKIGDSIQVGDSVGVVERIGIRACVLRTNAGAELIVPNGSLISDRVTNWTFSSRERSIIIPFNIARGPDIAHVMQVLTATAALHPKVQKHPPPQVQVTALGANLSFELRAWTSEVNDWSDVRSELILAISTALAKENIVLA